VANKEWDVDIISLPFGFPQRIRGIRNEIRNALHDGKAVFAAASNDGGNADRAFPASQDDVICVHSTDGLGNTSLFNPTALSNTDNFCVVGENVEAAWPSETTDKLGGLRRMSGTSVAAAVAVAIAALMIGFVGHNIPEHVGWAIPLKSRDGIKAIFQTISERRNGQYDLVNPIKAFGGGSEDERKKILRDVEARLR
jgi:subtilisin family serine protease